MQLKNNEVSAYLENISLLILGILLLIFPFSFITITTDPFTLPKQVIFGAIVLISLILLGAKMISDGSVRIRRTPYDFPIVLFTVIVLASSFFAINRFDSIFNSITFLFAVLAYFIIVNIARNKSSIFFLLASLTLGASLVSIFALLNFVKLYVFPYAFTHFPSFNTFGSLLDQTIYLLLILPVAVYYAMPLLRVKSTSDLKGKEIAAGVASLIILIGLSLTSYQFLTTQKNLILPFETGFQTAFAAISQDAGRTATGFFLGSGFGTYVTDFTRFKQAAFNLNQNLWSLTFFRSSSFVLELLATTGVLGLLSYLYLTLRVIKDKKWEKNIVENAAYIPLILGIVASILLPFTFTSQTILFVLLGIFAAIQGLKSGHSLKEASFYDIVLHFVAFKKGIIPFATSPIVNGETLESNNLDLDKEERAYTKFLPIVFFVLFLGFAGYIGFNGYLYVSSDVTFQNSLVAASANNGLQTYNDQVNAIKTFPLRDSYYRVYSQTNLALANSLAAQQPKNSTPSAQIQQTIYTLIQQSINAARTAVTVSPQNVVNWENLTGVYRALIGFGQNAESFAVLTNQQAILLNPNNPQEYINLGGIYYQLGQWDEAQRQFQIAINLKPDLANAYYNLGHALESKGDLKTALTQYQAVRTLVASDQPSVKKINEEIAALEQKIGASTQTQAQTTPASDIQNQPPLGINTPENQLPEQKSPVKIPAPNEPSPTPTKSVTPTPVQGTQITPSPTVAIPQP
ncbi:tetratricopeptide repeat protein [Candidatus Microgenomates bacterium]|nr:MAG: tetratricopeptide repeat protein [Candidatus Microgenomates bacterium]